MALLDIVLHPDSRLRQKCEPVTEINDEIRRLLGDMAETMYSAPGIGLAGPQVASSHRVIVVDVAYDGDNGYGGKLYKIVNPQVVEREGVMDSEEGCLSIPGIIETVKRAATVVVEGLDENGDPLSVEAEGLLSACLQHEIDHLDGILFIDHLSKLKQHLVKTKYNKMLQQGQHEYTGRTF